MLPIARLGVALALAISAPPLRAAPADAPPPDRAARISNAILTALVAANGVPGMGAAVWRDGRPLWTGAAGFADREAGRRVDDRTIFRLASVSKLFAATAAARLRQEGKLDVDAPVRSIVRWLPGRWPAISTAQLVAHTSGLPHYQDVDATRGGRHFKTMRESVAIFQDRDLLSPPGTRYEYSSWGYTLLSAVVEEAARVPYLDYLTQQITPGLTIVPDRTDSGDPHAAIAYEFADGGVVRRAAPHDYSYTWGGGGLGATAPDLASWGDRLLAGKIVTPATLTWMATPARLADGSDVRERSYTIGFGWRAERDIDGREMLHHAGVTNGARSVLLLFPEQKLSISLLSNALWVSAIERSAEMLAAPFQPGATGSAPCPTVATRYTGSYAGKPIDGTARFAVRDGICTGEVALGAGSAFGAFLNRFDQPDPASVTIIGVAADGGVTRAALVTPIGVYDLRSADGRRFTAKLGAESAITLTIE